MIEMMLEAERALAVGLLDQADRLYGQVVAADPRNAIAVVGLARVSLERGDERGTYLLARRALTLDPENPMARHLAMRMSELLRARGETLPADASHATAAATAAATARPTEGAAVTTPARTVPTATTVSPARAAGNATGPTAGDAPRRPGVVGRILRRGSR